MLYREEKPPHFGHSMFMILSWSFRLLEHAGCLASLQHYLVHRVSPFGDLTLSLEGLRVPTWVRLSHQYFVGGLVFGFFGGAVHSETAQS